MHPAPSVILFTSLSGLGFGLMFWLGFGFPNVTGWVAFWFFFIAYVLSVGGLLASTLHLGNPQRAMYAFSQWRTSWLSREGVMAVTTLLVMAVYAVGLIFFGATLQFVGWLGAILALATVFTTSMIYGQLRTVPRWNMPLIPVLFLTYALSGGALLAGQVMIAGILLALLTGLQLSAWRAGNKAFAAAGHSLATATGLGHLGDLRLLEGPHTGPNYLLREMVYVVGRKHAQKLRIISAISVGVVPVAILLFLPFNHWLGAVSVISHLLGLISSRWLFFAEAEHVVGLYYDKR